MITKIIMWNYSKWIILLLAKGLYLNLLSLGHDVIILDNFHDWLSSGRFPSGGEI